MVQTRRGKVRPLSRNIRRRAVPYVKLERERPKAWDEYLSNGQMLLMPFNVDEQISPKFV